LDENQQLVSFTIVGGLLKEISEVRHVHEVGIPVLSLGT
jgi:hypothetical protein